MPKKIKGPSSIADPDNAELTLKDFRRARPVAEMMPGLIEAAKRGRGRPKLERPKEHITLRLDADMVEIFKAEGPGWQTRINDVLVRAAKRRSRVA
jgi:uncharacterized protein (DUF4415 family)